MFLLISVFRIIPAYAGSTARKGGARAWCGDHPRIRGEHLEVFRVASRRHGIIPAYAGSTIAMGICA